MSEMIVNKHRAPLDGRREPMSMGCKCMSEKDVLSSGHTNRPGRGKTDASPGGGGRPPTTSQGQIRLGLSAKEACGCLKHMAEQGKSGFWGTQFPSLVCFSMREEDQ